MGLLLFDRSWPTHGQDSHGWAFLPESAGVKEVKPNFFYDAAAKDSGKDDGLRKKPKVPVRMAEEMRRSVAQYTQQIKAKTKPYTSTYIILEDTIDYPGLNPEEAIELILLAALKNSTDQIHCEGLATSAAVDYADAERELFTAKCAISTSAGSSEAKHGHPTHPANTLRNPSPQHSVDALCTRRPDSQLLIPPRTPRPETPKHQPNDHFDKPAELTATESLFPSSQSSTPYRSLPSSGTSDFDMDDLTELGENELYHHARLLQREAHEISMHLYTLRRRRKNHEMELNREEQSALEAYRIQLAMWESETSETIAIQPDTALAVEKILTKKRDASGPLDDEISELEGAYFHAQSHQRQLEDQLHRHYSRVFVPASEVATRPENLRDSDDESEASELDLFDPAEYHPLYNEWQDREAQLKILQERLWSYEEEEARLASQKKLRERVGKHLAKADEDKLAVLPSEIADLSAKFEHGEEEWRRMKEECVQKGIIDESGRPRRISEEQGIQSEDGCFEVEQGNEQTGESQERQGSRDDVRLRQRHAPLPRDDWEIVRADHHQVSPEIPSPASTARDDLEQRPDLNFVVSPPSESQARSELLNQPQSASALLAPPKRKSNTSKSSAYPMFALSANGHICTAQDPSQPLSIDAWIFDQLIDSSTERRLLASILQAQGVTDYEDLEAVGIEIVRHWNDTSDRRGGSPAPTQKDFRESMDDIKRFGYDRSLVQQVVGYALWRCKRAYDVEGESRADTEEQEHSQDESGLLPDRF